MKEKIETTTNHQVGVIIGTLEGLIKSVDGLSKRFENHLKDHRQNWQWVFPTIISLATLIVLMLHYW